MSWICRDGLDEKLKKIEHFQRVLEDLVGVNSLFTFAMFIGMSFTSTNPQDLQLPKECQASRQTKMTLLFDEVVSFVCFLLSSLVATALKMDLSTCLMPSHDSQEPMGNEVRIGFRSLMIMVSMAGSILGCVYLTLAMNNVVRVLLGNITCGDRDTIEAAASLICINVLALLVYVPSMMRAVFLSYSMLEVNNK